MFSSILRIDCKYFVCYDYIIKIKNCQVLFEKGSILRERRNSMERKSMLEKRRIYVVVLLLAIAVICFALGMGLKGFGESEAQTQEWMSFHGSTDLEYTDGALQVHSYSNPGSIVFTGGQFSDYEMEAEMELLDGPWFGVMYRANGDWKGFYQIGTTYRQLKNHQTKSSGNGWDEESIVQAQEGYTPYALGVKVQIKVTVQDDHITLQTKVEGDSEFYTEFENQPIDTAALGEAGYIGFCFQHVSAKIYSVTIRDLNSDYSYVSDFASKSEVHPEWEIVRGSGDMEQSDGKTIFKFAQNPTVYGITNVDFTDYVLETEFSIDSQWGGIAFRINGAYKGFYVVKSAAHSFSMHETNSGNGWGDSIDAPNSGYTPYTYGSRVRLKAIVKDNKITVQSMLVGKDTEYYTDVEEYDIATLDNGRLGTKGGVGLVCKNPITMTVYSFKVTDSVTGNTYYLPSMGDGVWDVTDGEATVSNASAEGEEIRTISSTADVSAYMLTGVNFNDTAIETEISLNTGSAGVVFRGYDGSKGIYMLTSDNKRVIRTYSSTESAWGADTLEAEAGYTPYAYGDRIRLRLRVQDNKLSVESMIIGKETEYRKDFVDIDLSLPGEGVLGDNGEVGLYVSADATLTVFEFRTTDSMTGRTYDLFEKEEQAITESVVFDGNTAAESGTILSQTPDTTEVWFKTSSERRQTIISDFKSVDTTLNGFYLDVLAGGQLFYFEANGVSAENEASNLRLTTSGTYADGQWYKAVIRRQYDEGAGLVGVRLSVYSGETLMEEMGTSRQIAEKKLSLYESNGDKFISETYLQIGSFRQTRYLFYGEIAEIRMWDHTLTDAEAAQARYELTGQESGLLHDFVPGADNQFTDKANAPVAVDTYEVWMQDYVLQEADFRIAVLPDVQYINEGFEIRLREYFTWIRDNAERLNIRLVVSVGDMVNTCTPEQYAAISEAASILDGTVPFMPVPGNHEYPSYGRDVMFDEYFPYEKYSAQDCWGGAFREGSMENYYYRMEINGQKFLFMGLEVAVRPAVADWANEVIAAHSDYKVIIVNHAFLDPKDDTILEAGEPGAPESFKTDGGMSAIQLWEEVISKHQNIVMVLCGHMDTHRVAHVSFTGENGNAVETLLFDGSMVERANGCASLVGLLGFHDGSNQVDVNFYSIVKDAYFCDINQYSLELDWQEEYRITFEDGRGGIVYDESVKAGSEIVAPESPENYSDGTYDYVFQGWEGYEEGMTATQNYLFKAVYGRSDTAGIAAKSPAEIEAGICKAKEKLFAGGSNAYVALASNVQKVDSVCTNTTYANGDTIEVFGRSEPVYTVSGGTLAVHVLALYSSPQITIYTENAATSISLPEVSDVTQAEITLPSDLSHSRYDYLSNKWNVSVRGDDRIALTVSAAVGENVVVAEEGRFTIVEVTRALGRNVALYPVSGENYETELTLIQPNGTSAARIQVVLLQDTEIDGDLGDWNAAVLATGRTMTGLDDTSHKNVTFYAQLTENGLYVAARAEHDLYVNDASDWFNNTNLEFYVNNESLRFWITANPVLAHEDVEGVIVTRENTEGKSNYVSVAEGFIPIEKLPSNALSGELNIGFAWKTPGDNIKYHNMTGGYDWWYPTRRHPAMIAEQYFVNSFGICDYSSVRTVNNILLDGDFSDFDEAAQQYDLRVYGTGESESIGYTVCAQYIRGNGVYVGLVATHATNPWPNDNLTWSNNTNFEFYIGENRYYITCAGAAAGNGLYAKNTYLSQTYDAESSLWTTTIELFIPVSAFGTVSDEEFVRMGFAFKPTGESVAVGGREADDWWYLNGHLPSDVQTQFFVYDCGISSTKASAVNTPETCLDLQIYQLTSPNTGEVFTIAKSPDLTEDLHAFGELTIVTEATCRQDGVGYFECELCHERVMQTIPATGEHIFGEWEQVKAPTCTESGEERRYCQQCGEYESRIVEATGHGSGEWVVVAEPEGGADGREELVCEHCGAVLNSRTIPAEQEPASGGCNSAVGAGCCGAAVVLIGAAAFGLRRRKTR